MRPEQAMAEGVAKIMAVGLMFWAFMMLLMLVWIVSLVDVIRSDFENPNNKTIWILLLIFIAPIATILYLTIGRGQKQKNFAENKITSCIYDPVQDRIPSNSDKNGGNWM